MKNEDTRGLLQKVRCGKPRFIDIPGMAGFSELVQGFTTRYGGVSSGPFESLNLNFFRGDDPGKVLENFRLLAEDLGVSPDDMVLSKQVHGCSILRVDESHKGMGIVRERSYGPVDGLTTDIPGIMLVTYYADCVPLYFYDPVKKAICLSHSGWRGTLLDMAGKSVKTMIDCYNSRPENIRVGIGPHIRSCCFEVGEDVAGLFFEKYPKPESYARRNEKGKWTLDLEAIIRKSLSTQGIQEKHVYGCGICTRCEHDVFFSHRGSGGHTGTGAAFLMIRRNI